VLVPFFSALAPILDNTVRPMLTNLKVTGPVVAKVLSRRPQTDALFRTTTAVTMVEGGVKPNVLPQEATATVNFRIVPGDTIASVLDHVRAVVGPDIRIEAVGEMREEPSEFSSTESDAWNIVQSTIEETFPEVTVAPWILTGATDSRYFKDVAGDIYGFGPFSIDLDDPGIHGTNERVRVTDAEQAVSFFCRLIRSASLG
jgi:carboxypeptidase PM20D1